MKVGIITLSASDNCGSILQAYALQKIIGDKYRHTVEIINFSSKKSRKMYRFQLKSLVKMFLRGYRNIFQIYQIIKRQSLHRKCYESFRNKNLKSTKKMYLSNKSLENENFDYDIVICGSDQVWNIEMYDFDKAFFLPWVHNAKKAAYAPSFGLLDINKHADTIKRYLHDFHALSLRDDVNCGNLSKIINRKIVFCADPTLLIEENHWLELAGDAEVKQDCIFYYSWSYNSGILNAFVCQQAKKLNLPVYVVDARKWSNANINHYNFILPEKCGPDVFLNLMKHAKLVFVESFHGVIFSFIFRRQFWLLEAKDNAALDPRLGCIVTQLGLRERLLRPSAFHTTDIQKEINYQEIDLGIYKKVIADSFCYLDSIFR
jgi:hypothetical protein